MLKKLKKHVGIQRLLIEGGGALNAALIRDKLVDEIQINIAPLIFGGASAPTMADGLGLIRENAIQLQTEFVDPLENGGVIIRYRILQLG